MKKYQGLKAMIFTIFVLCMLIIFRNKIDWWALFSLFIGAITTYWASRFFFMRSLEIMEAQEKRMTRALNTMARFSEYKGPNHDTMKYAKDGLPENIIYDETGRGS